MKRDCIIIGAGTYGEVYLSYLQQADMNVVGFLDDNSMIWNSLVKNVPVLGGISMLETLKNRCGAVDVYCPIGNNKLRVDILKRASELGYNTPNFIHHTANIDSSVTVACKGVYILPNTIIMPWCVISDYVMISAGTIVSHHSIIGEGVFLSFGVNFGASIVAEKHVYIGIGATIMTGVKKLGEDCLIGAGSVVVKDVTTKAVMAGVPAKLLRIKE